MEKTKLGVDSRDRTLKKLERVMKDADKKISELISYLERDYIPDLKDLVNQLSSDELEWAVDELEDHVSMLDSIYGDIERDQGAILMAYDD